MTAGNQDREDTAVLAPATFDALLVEVLPRLRGYVASLLGGWAAVEDVVQDACMVMLQKRDTFEAGTNFTAWAFRVAYFTATSWRRDMQREGRVMFSDTFFQHAAAIAEGHFTEASGIHDALGLCLQKLPPDDRDLLHLKYVEQVSLTEHAQASGRNANAVHKTISRIRLALRQCIRRHLDESPARP
jgi:RNA polymerase sigma-70 factor, ECF subfamily